jgi:hypothetical protein
MPKNRDYIPWKSADLLLFASTLYAYALLNFVRWNVPSPQSILEALIGTFETALAAYQNPNHGKIDTLNKNNAQKALIHGLRTYIQGFLMKNPAVTDEDKEKMGLPLRDDKHTSHPIPDVKPVLEAVPSGKGKHTVKAINSITGTKQKPEYVTGVAFAYRLRDVGEPMAQAKDMPSQYQTSVVKDFQWEEEFYGKACDYACAYEADGGKRGPWSDVVSLIVT